MNLSYKQNIICSNNYNSQKNDGDKFHLFQSYNQLLY